MQLPDAIASWLSEFHRGGTDGDALARIVLSAAVLLIAFAAFYISRLVVRSLIHRVFERTRFSWDNILIEKKVFPRATLLVPGLIVSLSVPLLFSGYPRVGMIAAESVNIYLIFVTVWIIDALINTGYAIYETFSVSREVPLKGFVQVLKIILYFICIILIISVLLNRTPVYLLSGLGAMTAVLMLIFKDPILGFVAGIQLISNKMLNNGDWIEMPKYGADGDVIDITLTTVKVRNWDQTITTIPTYALIADSFKNWRGMQESGGRRIKRTIYIDINTIRFCTPEMIERFATIRYISAYMADKNRELEEFNVSLTLDNGDTVNRRRLTNIGTFRAYVTAYLRNHPLINQDMTFLVRQLAPTAQGLPLEIYVFCADKSWANYEAVQSDIFDHLLAIVPEFDLRVYQYPSGRDLALSENAGAA